ncbi:uncharacterized protein NFIA_022930 [Aspergillus fischeri NRRL 181]|uniref:Conserved serine-rich protein n=1 Tax=Neosartorya fischeri (strain ATCC 1020 / DSM 3700 / CBS 544.65 / FGSC A1164 / JCM 1740 / NRRL 181 / WB 181) TaxID=331117 RepID=A1D589_NEOFI|nr:conserved serine-rich protein [Aspergillus fischeri NRRL 181]EAW23582.1 conserved serine-rich protein [Aspergillus fischeri NRRL 181]KAG2027614.1 hypothetical protein GB937_000053 [Aspergillus fischeri]
MVFLRLTVKVYPREQTQSSSSFSIRSFLGDRDRDASSQNSGSTAGKPASFLLVLENPEEVTMGGLAGMIREKWAKLRPNAEPLEIKKLVDDEHDSDDLDAELTVADVFVDNGRARTDGADQRGTVRVIQKPAPYAPVRFPSVSQDWDAAAQDFERQIKIKKEAVQANLRKIPTIAEESQSFSERDTPSAQVNGGPTPAATADDRERRREVPVSSVEQEEIPMSPPRWGESPVHENDSQEPQGGAVAATPQHKRMESQELGESPSPERQWTPTPKTQTSPAKRGSVSKQVPATRSISQFVAEPDFPSSNRTERERIGSESPLSPRQAPSRPEREVDEEEEVETDISQPERESDEEEEEEADDLDNDGDVAMNDGDVAAAEEVPAEAEAEETDEPVVNGSKESSSKGEMPAVRQRKRKKSLEEEQPNKEPRLEPRSPGSSDKENNPSQSLSEPPVSSPLARRHERAPSFSGIGRRPSLSEKPESAKPGLGLGITKSPPSKSQVMIQLSQEAATSISGTPLFSSKASTIRRASLVENDATPSKQTPALDRVKQLHSALRKDSPADKSAQRRSVSFAEGEDVVITASTLIPKSTPQTNPKGKGTPGSEPGKKSSTPSKMVFPTGVPQERVEQLMREANQKFEKHHKDKEEVQEMIRAAKEQNKYPAYVRNLEELLAKLDRVQKLEKRNRSSERDRLERARADLRAKREEIAKMEADMGASSQDKQPKADSSKIHGNANTPKADTASKAKGGAKKSTPAAEQNGSAKKAAEAKKGTEPSTTPTTAERKGSTKKAAEAKKGPDSTATPTAPKPRPTEEPKGTPNEPPENSAEDAKLPPVTTIQRGDLPNAKANGTKKSPASEPVDVSSTTSSSSEESSEHSESENQDDDETDAEAETQTGTDKPAKSKADLLRRSSATPSSQGNARSPAPSQSASQSWGQPINGSRSRATLKTLLVDKKKESAEKAQQAKKKISAAPKRPRNIFSPPSDDDSDESESSSSSSSSSSESESDKDSGSDNESHSSADHGDIMSSGTVGKLRAARKK